MCTMVLVCFYMSYIITACLQVSDVHHFLLSIKEKKAAIKYLRKRYLMFAQNMVGGQAVKIKNRSKSNK